MCLNMVKCQTPNHHTDLKKKATKQKSLISSLSIELNSLSINLEDLFLPRQKQGVTAHKVPTKTKHRKQMVELLICYNKI